MGKASEVVVWRRWVRLWCWMTGLLLPGAGCGLGVIVGGWQGKPWGV